MKKLNTVIIGCGAIFENHLNAIKDNENVVLYGVCDINEDIAYKVAKENGCIAFTDYKKVCLDTNVDVVHICTPHYLHDSMAIEAMEAGKHVLCEKPMAISVACAEVINRVSEKTGKTFGVCFQNRYNPTSEKIKALLESGEMGKVKGAKAIITWNRGEAYYNQANWRGTFKYEGGGLLINQAIHTLDMLQWFFGGIKDIQADVMCTRLKDIVEVEDSANAYIRFENDIEVVFFATNAYGADSPIELEIICENGIINMRNELNVTFLDGKMEIINDHVAKEGEKWYWGKGHKYLIDDFYNKVICDKKFEMDGHEAIKSIKMIEAIYRSAALKNRVQV